MTSLAVLLQSGGMFGSFSGIGNLAIPIVFVGAMYFLMIAPNQKKQKAWAQMLGELKAGDKVTTGGGLRGTVVSVKDEVVVLRVLPDGVKLEFVKSSIASVVTEDAKA